MVSVTERIAVYNRYIGQPPGGFIPPRMLVETALDGATPLDHRTENIAPTTVGIAVDYLSRIAHQHVPAEDFHAALADAFHVSLLGAKRIARRRRTAAIYERATGLLDAFTTLERPDGDVTAEITPEAVYAACELATYDVGLRAGAHRWKPSETEPDALTTRHIQEMVARACQFFDVYGPVTKDGFVFASEEQLAAREKGGYTTTVTSGDGDFLTADTIWDFKVSTARPTKDHTLQLLMYYLMGKQSGLPEFETQTHIGVFNPRLGLIHRIKVGTVSDDVIATVRRDVIGYAE